MRGNLGGDTSLKTRLRASWIELIPDRMKQLGLRRVGLPTSMGLSNGGLTGLWPRGGRRLGMGWDDVGRFDFVEHDGVLSQSE